MFELSKWWVILSWKLVQAHPVENLLKTYSLTQVSGSFCNSIKFENETWLIISYDWISIVFILIPSKKIFATNWTVWNNVANKPWVSSVDLTPSSNDLLLLVWLIWLMKYVIVHSTKIVSENSRNLRNVLKLRVD